MEILENHSYNYYGNDCYIETDLALMKSGSLYFVVETCKVTGWCENASVQTSGVLTEEEAREEFENRKNIIEKRI